MSTSPIHTSLVESLLRGIKSGPLIEPSNLFSDKGKEAVSHIYPTRQSSDTSSFSPSKKRVSSKNSFSLSPIKPTPRVQDPIVSIILDLEKNSEYEYVRRLGKGAQGEVILVHKKDLLYAAKIYKIGESDGDLKIGSLGLAEMNFYFLFYHPHIAKARDIVLGQYHFFLILDLADTDLESHLKQNKLPLKEKVKHIFDLGEAFGYIRRSRFVHCDLKTNNILIRNGEAYISDMGLVRSVENTTMNCQVKIYKAPEVYHYQVENIPHFRPKISLKNNLSLAEIWSMGLLFLDILYNKSFVTSSERVGKLSSYPNMDHIYGSFLAEIVNVPQEKVYEIVKSLLGELPSDQEDELLHLICDYMLVINQKDRLALYATFMNHPFFASFGMDFSDAYVQEFMYPIVDFDSVDDIQIVVTTVNQIIDAHNHFKDSLIVTMNTIDYFLQNISFSEDPHLFSVCIAWYMGNIYNVATKKITLKKRLKFVPGRSYDDAVSLLREIIAHEKGCPMYDSLYFTVRNMEEAIEATTYMRDPLQYFKMGSPDEVAKKIYIEDGSPKNLQYVKI